jgi:DegV family protein with EDD domain
VVGIHLSTKLSATYATAVQAAQMLPGKQIEVLDSNATAMAQGFVVLAAARAAAAGQNLAQVVAATRAATPNAGIFLTVETLEYLRRGGRIGGATAFLGGMLDLKPILELREGRIEAVERVRTKKKALDRVIELAAAKIRGKAAVRIAVLHAAAPQEAEDLLQRIKGPFGAVEYILSDVSPTIAVHTGPGTVAIAFCYGE